MVFGIFTPGPMELVIVLVLALVIFGAGKLPGVGRALGQSIREFKGAVTTTDEEKKTEQDEKNS